MSTREVAIPQMTHTRLWLAAEPILRASRYHTISKGRIQPEEVDWAMVEYLVSRAEVWVYPGPDAIRDRDGRLYAAIARAYPDLAAECRRRLSGKSERPGSRPRDPYRWDDGAEG